MLNTTQPTLNKRRTHSLSEISFLGHVLAMKPNWLETFYDTFQVGGVPAPGYPPAWIYLI